MLEKPDLEYEEIIDCLQEEYGLRVENISFLPIGADLNTAVYCTITKDDKVYFVMLRRGDFNDASVAVPNFLNSQGTIQIIPS
jgi:spectinomycin phosphotransferase